MTRGFANRKENNWCLLCKKSVHDIAEHMEEHYNLSELSRKAGWLPSSLTFGGVKSP